MTRRIKAGETQFICAHCGLMLENWQALNSHIQEHNTAPVVPAKIVFRDEPIPNEIADSGGMTAYAYLLGKAFDRIIKLEARIAVLEKQVSMLLEALTAGK